MVRVVTAINDSPIIKEMQAFQTCIQASDIKDFIYPFLAQRAAGKSLAGNWNMQYYRQDPTRALVSQKPMLYQRMKHNKRILLFYGVQNLYYKANKEV